MFSHAFPFTRIPLPWYNILHRCTGTCRGLCSGRGPGDRLRGVDIIFKSSDRQALLHSLRAPKNPESSLNDCCTAIIIVCDNGKNRVILFVICSGCGTATDYTENAPVHSDYVCLCVYFQCWSHAFLYRKVHITVYYESQRWVESVNT